MLSEVMTNEQSMSFAFVFIREMGHGMFMQFSLSIITYMPFNIVSSSIICQTIIEHAHEPALPLSFAISLEFLLINYYVYNTRTVTKAIEVRRFGSEDRRRHYWCRDNGL